MADSGKTMGAEPDGPRLSKAAEKSQATRAALIELAVALFSERGYIQTSIRDLAHRSGMTSGAIYGHFRNKADLLAAAVNHQTTVGLEASSIGAEDAPDYVEVVARLAGEQAAPDRRQLRALIVQGAAAAHTDEETRELLRDEQLAHIDRWVELYEENRERLGLDPDLDVRTAVILNWAVELGLGVLDALGIEPGEPGEWSDVSNRLARSWQLPPDPRGVPRRKRRAPARRKA